MRHLLSEASRRLEKAGADTPLMESQLLLGIVTGRSRLEILRDVGFLVLAGILLVKPRTRFSLDGLLMGER